MDSTPSSKPNVVNLARNRFVQTFVVSREYTRSPFCQVQISLTMLIGLLRGRLLGTILLVNPRVGHIEHFGRQQ